MWDLNGAPDLRPSNQQQESNNTCSDHTNSKGKRVGSISNSSSSMVVMEEDDNIISDEDNDSCSRKRSNKLFGFTMDGEGDVPVTHQFFPVDEQEVGPTTSLGVGSGSGFPAAHWVGVQFSGVGAGGYVEKVVGPEVAQPLKKSRRGPRSRSSQYRGVTFYRRTGRWESHIWDCGKQVYLGGFDTASTSINSISIPIPIPPPPPIRFNSISDSIQFLDTMNSKTPARISELPPKSKEILSDFFFQRNQNPSPKEIASLSKQVGLDGKRIRAWFSYKRFSEKKRASKSSGKKPTRIKELPPNLKRILSDFFQRNQNPNKQQKIDLATKVGLDLEKITRWFSDTRFQKNKKRGKGHSSGTAVEKIKPAQKKEKDPQKPPITKGEHSTFKGADRAEKLERVQSLISRVRDIKVMCTDFRAELSLEIKEFREVADYYKNELEKVLEVICVNAEEAQQAAEEYNGSCREADKKKLKIAELIKKEKEVRVLVKEKTPQQSNQKKVHWAPTPASKASYQPNTGGTRKRISFQASKCATPATNTKKPPRTPKNGDTTKQNAGLRGPTEPVEWQSLSRAKKPRPTPKNGDTTKQNAGLRGPTEPVEWQSLSGAKDDEEVTTVVFSPDHMAYQNRYCIDSLLTFTSSCIIIEGSSLGDDEEPFRLQWGIEDILYIKSQRYQNAGITMLKIHVLMEDTLQAENVECPSGTELRFAFIGTDWYGKQEAVTSLNDTFKTLWTNINESGDTVHGYTEASFPKYFPCFYEPFEEVIYPKGEVDAVSIRKRDVDMLLPDTYVNDTIIDFYIKYLENKIDPEDRPRFHFFNSFFFRKLADPDKEPLEACKGKEAFQRVRKWTRKVNLFEKDYVFIPVNYNKHWSLIILSHLGEVATYQDEDVTKLSKVPCVLHMDPIRGNHTGLNGLMQSYLKEEWRGRVPETSEEICSRFDNLRFISLELPQQPNLFDCGLFLLHYVELFLEQAPIDFNPFKISKSVGFLNVDWFPPADASLKRVVIQRLVYDLLEAPSHVAPPVRVNDDTIHREAAVNFFPQTFNNDPSTVCQTSHDDEGIEISLLTTEPCPVGPTESLKPTFEPRSFLCMQFPSFNEATFDGYKSSLAPSLEENIENGGQSVYSVTEIDLEQDNGITPEIPYSSQNLKNSNFYEISPQTSISGCEDSLEVINSNKQMNEEVCFMEMRHEPRSPLMEHVEIQANGSTGSGESSGLESDVQHPTKKMRTTEPPLEDGSPFS